MQTVTGKKQVPSNNPPIKPRNRYFLALVTPPPLFDQILALKTYFKDQFQSKAALNSPPHITLQMPFEWPSEKEEELIDALQNLSSTLTPTTVKLKNFDCFSPHVIFIHVIPSAGITSLQSKVRQFCKAELDLSANDQPFHPHVTIGFRDLKKPAFNLAWTEFKKKLFNGKFLADQISLLIHDGKKWKVIRNFPLPSLRA